MVNEILMSKRDGTYQQKEKVIPEYQSLINKTEENL